MKKKLFFCAFLIFCQNFLSIAQVKVTFKTGKIPIIKQGSTRLYLAGSFNNWNPSDASWELQNTSGFYQLIKALPKGAYDFKVTRGDWSTVECTKLGQPVNNRTIRISKDTSIEISVDGWQDSYRVATKKHTASPHVHIINEKFNIPQLGRQRRIWVYLPADYDQSKRNYPVIYMNDGQNLFDEFTGGYGEWRVDETMDKLPNRNQSIIVGIDHGGDYRVTEYDPYDSKFGKGRGADYADFLVHTLKPYIDQHYRTKRAAHYNTIAGSSMGGLISMYTALKYPDVFGNAGIFSAAFWIAPDIYKYATEQRLNPKARFYFVCGDSESEDEVAEMNKMVEIIRSKGLTEKNAPSVIVKGAKHNEQQWSADFPEFYNWLIK